MSGELSFYDRKTLRKLSTVDAHMTVAYEWSPCSRFFLTVATIYLRTRLPNSRFGAFHPQRITISTRPNFTPRNPIPR